MGWQDGKPAEDSGTPKWKQGRAVEAVLEGYTPEPQVGQTPEAPKFGSNPNQPLYAVPKPAAGASVPLDPETETALAAGKQILTQGGRLDPKTASRMLLGDVETALDSMAGMGQAAKAAGQAAKPALKAGVNALGWAGTGVGKAAAETIGALGTHTGGRPLREMAKTGFESVTAGKAKEAEAALKAMRGKSDAREVLPVVQDALSSMRRSRSDAYRSGMVDIKNDAAQLKFHDIDKALLDAEKVVSFHGVPTSAEGAKVYESIADKLRLWKANASRNPHFATPEGMDELKQSIGDDLQRFEIGTKEYKVASDIYNAVKSTIETQAPTYAKVMKDYSDATEHLRELERALSLKSTSSQDTAIRKLLSVMRNNVNTNYGTRLNMVEELAGQPGGSTVIPMLAGHALSSPFPRGVGGPVEAGLATTGALFSNPAYAALLPAMSPRLMGEAAHYAGKGAGYLDKLTKSIFE